MTFHKGIKQWLILDVNYLCHRNYHVFGGLTYGDIRTGVVYGIMRDIVTFQDLHMTKNIIFCFDSRHSIRKEIYPEYKGNRNQSLEEERIVLARQINKLRTTYLPELGFQNILVQKGYEADDMVAMACKAVIRRRERAIIIGSDHDFYQLLKKRIWIWNPHKKEAMTRKSFIHQFGIKPWQWPEVLAMAGGHDNIRGVEKVGEITACRYLRGELRPESVAHQNIRASKKHIELLLQIVKLPLEGAKDVELTKDTVSRESWRKLAHKLGIKSILGD